MGQKLVSPVTYWRRRVIVLAACLAVLALPAWAVNQALGGRQASGQGSPGSPGGDAAGPGAHPVAGPRHRQSLAGETADLGSRPPADPRPSAPAPQASTAPPPGAGRQACPSGAVTLTFRSARHRYGRGELVTFVVGALSTAHRPCRFDLGSRFVSVVVASGGTPIWDSSSCLRGTGSQVITLRRGIPAFLRVSWDERTSLSGCPRQGSAVRAGTYTATAFDGRLRSHGTAFVLSGAAVP